MIVKYFQRSSHPAPTTTNEKDLQSNRNITPPRSFDDSDSYNAFFSQTNIDEDIEDERKETENSDEEGKTHLPMYTGEVRPKS